MGRLGSFIVGVVVGAGLVYTGLKYHVVRAQDGFHLIPKLQAQFDEAYVDIRAFGFEDWNNHRGLAVAIVSADKGYLMQENATSQLRQSVDSVLEGLNFRTPPGPEEKDNPWNKLPGFRK